ncbi:TolC family protein [Ginsengibacter hankyongi]|uniref:TolC family protein n=1 Tax=Ginsengibacter hankyongi TaxID=2607284 RepID=A0A5J5IDK7_9BACT|nr:TolC family protein [Ginsengibacter hankyongi]KAA9036620.1 TolC family protein [Ginsengibacter hankyongi]
MFFLLGSFYKIEAQEISQISIEQANQLARQNYPMVKQKDLIKQTANLNIENFSKGFLPQFTITGQATYQSDVTRIDIPVPGFKIEPLSKDQYKVLADVNELIYDGGVIKQQNELQQLNSEVQQQKIEVELYKLKERVNQLYLGILYLNAQKEQVALIKQDIQIGIKNMEARVENGVAFRSNLNILKAELLKNQQRIIELDASQKGMIETLELFMNAHLRKDVVFEKPNIQSSSVEPIINRPEIKLYTDQSKMYDHQSKIIKARNQPKASLFLQGGYGRPTFNFLKNQFDFFYIGGIRFNWALGGLYTKKNDNQLAQINKRTVDLEKETFLLNTNTQLKQQQSEIDKMNLLIASDEEIIALRDSVKEAAKAQLQNGVITANDYLTEINDEDQARQSLITHQIELLQAQINYQTISGKQ